MRGALCLIFLCTLLHAQSASLTHFEAASVKPGSGKWSQRGGPGTSDPGQIVYTNVDLSSLIYQAYDVRPHQLAAPDWMLDTRYDIAAKVPAGATRKEVRAMLRNLLEERFQLKQHLERRVAEAYVLTVAKGGPKLTVYPAALPEGFNDAVMPKLTGVDKDGFYTYPPGSVVTMMWTREDQTRIAMVREPIIELCGMLTRILKLPVLDHTRLDGRYDAHLRFAADPQPAEEEPNAGVPNASDPAPALYRAIDNQLGLKLEKTRLKVEFLVIDSALKTPLEN